MTPTYQAIRTAHFRLTLKTWLKGMDKALIAVIAVLQFILTALVSMLVYWLAQALVLLQSAQTGIGQRLLIVGAWQGTSFVLLRALREATFMPRATGFFDALPVTPTQRLRADVTLALQSYSFLWLPFAWVFATSPASSLLELTAVSLCLNIALLRGAAHCALVAIGALLLFALAPPAAPIGALACIAATALAALALWRSYLPGGVPVGRRQQSSAFAERLAIGSGLIVPLLMNELRSNLLVRMGFIAATLAGCLIVLNLRTNDVSQASVLIFVATAAALALYSLPALSRNTLLGKLAFLAGHPAFAQRMRLAAYVIPISLFALSLAIAWSFDHSGTAMRDALVFSVLFIGGIIGARLEVQSIRWIMPLCCMISLIIMSAML